MPDLPHARYQDLLTALTSEFTHTFGGCTIIHGLAGSYLSSAGLAVRDRINLIYTDTPYSFKDNFEIVSTYAHELKTASFAALEEEAILVAAIPSITRHEVIPDLVEGFSRDSPRKYSSVLTHLAYLCFLR